MSTLQDSDLFIVDRNGTNYQLPNSQMSTLQDTDLFVVERGGVNYQVPASDVNTGGFTGSLDAPVTVLTPLNGAGISELTDTPKSSVITNVGAGNTYTPTTSNITNITTADQEWAKYLITGGEPVPQADAAPAFDGNVDTRYLGDSGIPCVFAPATPIPIESTIE